MSQQDAPLGAFSGPWDILGVSGFSEKSICRFFGNRSPAGMSVFRPEKSKIQFSISSRKTDILAGERFLKNRKKIDFSKTKKFPSLKKKGPKGARFGPFLVIFDLISQKSREKSPAL